MSVIRQSCRQSSVNSDFRVVELAYLTSAFESVPTVRARLSGLASRVKIFPRQIGHAAKCTKGDQKEFNCR